MQKMVYQSARKGTQYLRAGSRWHRKSPKPVYHSVVWLMRCD